MNTVFDLLTRLLQNAPRKLAAVAVALVVWWIVASDTTTTAQRSLLVPIVVDGISSEQVVIGLPEFAEVTVTGPTARVDRLRPESFEAVLDLATLSGDFQVRIAVSPPQGITLQQVVPAEVIGIVETVTGASVPVVASLLGDLGPDVFGRVRVTPAQAQVRGRAAVVSRVVAVVVPLPVVDALSATVSNATGFAVDDRGRPLIDVQVVPNAFDLAWSLEPLWVERRVPLEVVPPTVGAWAVATEPPADVLVLGAVRVLAGVDRIPADVDLPTQPDADGRYDVRLALRLPEGVIALESPTVALIFTAPPTAQ